MAKSGREFVVTDNVLDVSTALGGVELYRHLTIKCNRPSAESPAPGEEAPAVCATPPGKVPGLLPTLREALGGPGEESRCEKGNQKKVGWVFGLAYLKPLWGSHISCTKC